MEIKNILFHLMTYSWTGNPAIDRFIIYSSTVLMVVLAAILLAILLKDPHMKQRKRPEDRFMFSECILVLLLLASNLLMNIADLTDAGWPRIMYFVPLIEEILYLLTILQWMIFVDYSLYRSRDHIRRRYKHALIPVIVVAGSGIAQTVISIMTGEMTDAMIVSVYILEFCNFAVELGYILTAVILVKKYDKQNREPKFLRLEAFIIPFVLGTLFRLYDASFMALGIVLTYGSILRRDRYLDHETGFYNRDFLEYRGKYRDEKEYEGGNGILITAAGHGKEMAELLRKLKPAGALLFALGGDCFLLLSESIRGSAVKMAVMTITEAAEASEAAFTPEIRTAVRGREETAGAFAARLMGMLPEQA
ncbi:MAG: hypothetical protein K6G83_10460 [Lachnospiraceae bacterium]|nr:hypothetical protein [Lachnospiraceae bacterium]